MEPIKWIKLRLTLIAVVITLLIGVIVIRAYNLQIADGDKYKEWSEGQYLKEIQLFPQRGVIFDRNNKELASSVEVYSVFANPRKISEPVRTSIKLDTLLNIDRNYLIKKFRSKRVFTWLKRQINPDIALKVKSLNLKGIGITTESKRFYPGQFLAGQILGFVGFDSKGLEGIELKHNKLLRGRVMKVDKVRDARGSYISKVKSPQSQQLAGDNLVLTIDSELQFEAERRIKEAVKTFNAKSGSVIAMNPYTGEILAMAVYPSFNPNNFKQYKPSDWRNRAFTDNYEPGSTFKAVTIAAALEEKLVKPGDVFYCEKGQYQIGRKVIHDTHPLGYLSLTEVMKFSSNICSAKIAESLGKKKFYNYIKKFGFGKSTNLELPGEARGTFRNYKKWSDIGLATISFGQGISTTPIQILNVYAAIANGGNLMQPTIIKEMSNYKGEIVFKNKPKILARIISEKNASILRQILASVTEEGGTGVNAAILNYKVAGKTGTSQKVDPISRGYSRDKRVASFAGFVPAYDPKIAIVVVVDEPKESVYGGTVAAPVFREVAHVALGHKPVMISETEQGKSLVDKIMEHIKFDDEDDGDLDDEFITPAVSSEVIDGMPKGLVMPDVRGLNIRDVIGIAKEKKLALKIIGTGKAVKQKPNPGSIIRPGVSCEIHFKQN